MAGELLIQVIDMGRFRAIRPALNELDAARVLGLESLSLLREAAASPLVRRHRPGLAGLLRRILRHPELELRVFLAPTQVDGLIAHAARPPSSRSRSAGSCPRATPVRTRAIFRAPSRGYNRRICLLVGRKPRTSRGPLRSVTHISCLYRSRLLHLDFLCIRE